MSSAFCAMSRRNPKRRNRPKSPATAGSAQVVGFFASDGTNALCDGDACVITGTAAALRRALQQRVPEGSSAMRIRATTFAEIWQGMQWGGAYAFDEQAYAVFRPLALRAGARLGPERFSPYDPAGLHLVRIQLTPQAGAGPRGA